MLDSKPQTSEEQAPAFPYQVLWAGYGNAEVTLRELEANADEYRILNETAEIAKPGTPSLDRREVVEVLEEYGLAEDNAEQFWLVCCFYLAPVQAEAFGIDPKQSRRVLSQAVLAAKHLDLIFDKLPPKVIAAMHYKRPLVAEVENPQGPDVWKLHTELRDLILVPSETAEDLRNVEGRPRNHHRNSMIHLLLELMELHGLDDLKVSDGTKKRPEAHLTGKAGRLLVALVALVEPNWREEWLAPKVEPVLRDFRKMQVRAKTNAR